MLCVRQAPLLLLLLSGVAVSVSAVSELPKRADIASNGAPADEGDSSFVSVAAGVGAQNYVFPSDPSILYNNGPFVTDPTGGFSGYGVSVVEQPALNTFGWNVDRDERATLADDFNVTDPAGWQIGAFTFYTYQTNSGSTDSTLNNVNVRIWKGPPGLDGSRIVWGDVCTNLFNGSSWTGVFRTLNTTPLNTQRLIMTLEAKTPDLYLPQGTYWVEWQAQGTLTSGPWGPPITILGRTATGNARQDFPTTGWKDVFAADAQLNPNPNAPQGIPFLIHAGTKSPSPGVTGFACLPETAPLPANSTASAEACIAACGVALAPNNAFYFANLYGTGNDTCGEFCTCAGTCQATRQVAGQTYPVCLASNVFDVKTHLNKKHTSKVPRRGMVRYTVTLRQTLAKKNLDTIAAGLGVRFRLTPTDEISTRVKLHSKVTPNPTRHIKSSAAGQITNEGNTTVVTWPAMALAYKKKYTFSVRFRVSKTALTGTRFVISAELFQAAITGVPPYCIRELGSQTLTVK